jgi:hypothetical protein
MCRQVSSTVRFCAGPWLARQKQRGNGVSFPVTGPVSHRRVRLGIRVGGGGPGDRPSAPGFVFNAAGRLHMAADDTVEPSKEDLSNAQSPVDLGRLYGYSGDDIACFYLRRRGGLPDIAYEEYICDLKSSNFPPSRSGPAK